MKAKEISVGAFYHDGKLGVREVIEINGEMVIYKTLSAKAQQFWNHQLKQMTTEIGSISEINLASFAAWAKTGFGSETLAIVMAKIAAQRVKLTAIEREQIDLVKTNPDYLIPMRTQAGLVKKGVIERIPETTGYQFTLMGNQLLSL